MKIEKNNETKSTFIINNKTFFIPSEWNLIKLSDITTVKDGTHDSPKYVQNGIPFITSKNLKNNKIDFIDVKYISKEDHEKFYKRSDVSMGDLLFGMIGTIGNPTIVDTDITFSIKNVALIKKNNNYCQKFLKYQMLSSNIITNQLNSLKNGGVLSFIKLSDIRNLMIIDIKLEKQKKISYILSLQEDHIENIKDLIKKIEIRNQYYAEKILSGELRVRKNEDGNIEFYNNTEWQEDSLKSLFFSKEYSVPKGWKIKPILDNIKLIKGISINSSEFNYQGMGRQFLRTGDVWEDASSKKEPAFFDGVVDDKFIKTENDYVSCFEGFNKEIGNGTIGLVTNLGEGIISSHLYKTENKNIDGKYYSASLLKTDYIQNILIRNAVGSTVLSSTKCLKDILFIFPDNDEMILIEEVLSSLYLESNNLRKVLEKEKLRFQWLLDNLLSGEYQVVDE